jgi:hypothetical protein
MINILGFYNLESKFYSNTIEEEYLKIKERKLIVYGSLNRVIDNFLFLFIL